MKVNAALALIILIAVTTDYAFSDVPLPFAPQPLGLHLSAGIGRLGGENQFEIGKWFRDVDGNREDVHFPLSRLEYPLEVFMLNIAARYHINEQLSISAGIAKNITTDSDKVIDSDWGVLFDNPNSLDIYSESDHDLDALFLDLGIRYRFMERDRFSLSAGAGYLYQQFDSESSNLHQTYPSVRAALGFWYNTLWGDDFVDGKVKTYEVTHSIPYLELAGHFRLTENVTIEGQFGYSPIASAKDEGNWLLRGLKFEGDFDGSAMLFGIKAKLDLQNRMEGWFITAGMDLVEISTDGDSKAYFNGIYDHTIYQETTSSMQHFSVSMGKHF